MLDLPSGSQIWNLRMITYDELWEFRLKLFPVWEREGGDARFV